MQLKELLTVFPLPWSAYVRLLTVKNVHAREFYETEALRGGWSIRQLDRQINSLFYERTALSKNKAAMLVKAGEPRPEEHLLPQEAIKDPFIFEFLDLKDEYSESDLEEALINHIDLKIGSFSHADAGQMNFYLNYARENWGREGENPPVGLILCSEKNEALARYALEGLANEVLAAEYRIALPDEELLAAELARTREAIEVRASVKLEASLTAKAPVTLTTPTQEDPKE